MNNIMNDSENDKNAHNIVNDKIGVLPTNGRFTCYRPQRSCQGTVFTPSVIMFTGGCCMCGRSMHGRGCMAFWQGVHGGMHGRGECMAGKTPLQRTVRILPECILVLFAVALQSKVVWILNFAN